MAGTQGSARPKTKHLCLDGDADLYRILSMGCDKIAPVQIFKKEYTVQIPTREEWKKGLHPPEANTLIWYTDGSKMDTGTGAGVYTNGYRGSYFSVTALACVAA
ncbi:jg20641 [Pararge aegeria aegeria]|uniref:Jg20641 protein n=1 Tax=Pararge aegeria aegeria TaxID=348720 RepID=A0A8S4RGI3_9NEOP|nr:jg20641 [Pararge aegeria aegeria]